MTIQSKKLTPLFAAALLLVSAGCARSPSTMGGGARLVVTLQFAGPVNPNYQYFFLIRNANDSSGVNGPVPVIAPPYGNGFATDLHPNSGSAAFTDFVCYGRPLGSTGYGVYHVAGGVTGDPNRNIFTPHGEPDTVTAPTSANPNVLQFELTLSRLTTNLAAGETDPNNGQPARWLQVNVIATTTTPTDPQNPDPRKFLDALGDQHQASGTFNTILTIDAARVGQTYQSSQAPADPFYEPTNDTYPAQSDPGIELTGWSVQVTTR